jgi:Ca-activated chloride channel family protein
MLKFFIAVFTILIVLSACTNTRAGNSSAQDQRPGKLALDMNPGSLQVTQLDGKAPDQKLEMPLQHTDVQIDVSGFVARATVTQKYHNPFDKPIEAVYTFPLPEDAAVDDMQMTIGKRVIKGLIKRREEARQLYEQAKRQGQRASLLEQERPNVFTQSVANILPGEEIIVTLRYVNILKYAEGNYELVFPMVVGPRYIPGDTATGQTGTGWAKDTNVVPDASKITPPVLKPGERTGHDISLAVNLEAGVPIQNLLSISHKIDVTEISNHAKTLQLHPSDTLPNKDFVLRYEVAGKAPEMATIAHHDERGGFFTLIIQPQRTVTEAEVIPRELIFIVDTSGSMSGFPIDKSKEAMRKLIKGMRSSDTFNVVRFSGDTGTLWNRPKPYTSANADEAMRYVDNLQGSGGTEMRQGILEALGQPAADGYLRIAFLLTDGYVGDEERILQTIEKERRGARVFSLGVGSSVNRYLLEGAAKVGRGEAFYVRQDEDSTAVIDKFFSRVDRPALGYITIDWGKLDVEQLYPANIPDLWAGQPIRIHGRYTKGGEEKVVIRGQLGKQPYEQTLSIRLPQQESAHEAMATVWARQKVQELMDAMVKLGQTAALVEEVTQVGLTFRLMTQWTSFVAVEENVVNPAGQPQTVVQPVELPEGVSYKGVFGGESPAKLRAAKPSPKVAIAPAVAERRYLNGDVDTQKGDKMGPISSFSPAQTQEKKPQQAPAPTATVPLSPSTAATTSSTKDAEEADNRSTGQEAAKAKASSEPQHVQVEILFADGQSTLTKEAKNELDQWVKALLSNLTRDKWNIQIIGHADSTEKHADKLSVKRAEVVRDYLVSQGVNLEWITITGKGAQAPRGDSATKTGRERNRWVEVIASP